MVHNKLPPVVTALPRPVEFVPVGSSYAKLAGIPTPHLQNLLTWADSVRVNNNPLLEEYVVETLYGRIGGRDAVNAAVDIFYGKVLADDRVKHFFGDVDMPGQIGKQKIFLTYAFGGPVKYTGKDMRSAHEHLTLTEEHFVAIAENLKSSLEELNVADDLIGEVMEIVAGTHDDVLNL